jgi:hypothetical protein
VSIWRDLARAAANYRRTKAVTTVVDRLAMLSPGDRVDAIGYIRDRWCATCGNVNPALPRDAHEDHCRCLRQVVGVHEMAPEPKGSA